MVDRSPVLLLVRRFSDLTHIRSQLTTYWSILSRHTAGNGPRGPAGVWIDEETLANVAAADAGDDTLRFGETAGVSGIWMLCWLDSAAHGLSRADLLTVLMQGVRDGAAVAPSARFLPVYPHDEDARAAQQDWQALQARHANRVLPPAWLDEAGALCLPPAPRDEAVRS